MSKAQAGAAPAPLRDILVVALEQAVAAPFATRQLADLGARVIKVERPGGGDFARGYDRSVHGQSSYFIWLNRGQGERRARRQGRRRPRRAVRAAEPPPTSSSRTWRRVRPTASA